ncbi:MAG: lysophospholipid acyltransferase family protein [Propionibacteriaceae bacterium]
MLKLLVFQPVARLVTRPWIEGQEHIPSSGPALLVGNHLHASETILLPSLLRRRITFPAKIELFHGHNPVGRFIGHFLAAIKMVPMDRSGGQASASSIDAIRDRLTEDGEVVMIFPEGSRSPDGRLYKGRTGTARIVLAAAGVPVIPLAVVNTVPRRNRLGIPMIARPGIRIGRPLDFSGYAAAGNDRDTLRWVTDELMNAVMELSGQVYVDVYASSVKQALTNGTELAQPTPPRPGFGRPRPKLAALLDDTAA